MAVFPDGTRLVYVGLDAGPDNDMDVKTEERSGGKANMDRDEPVSDAYDATHYARLRQLKKRYDPRILFRVNQNIAPAN